MTLQFALFLAGCSVFITSCDFQGGAKSPISEQSSFSPPSAELPTSRLLPDLNCVERFVDAHTSLALGLYRTPCTLDADESVNLSYYLIIVETGVILATGLTTNSGDVSNRTRIFLVGGPGGDVPLGLRDVMPLTSLAVDGPIIFPVYIGTRPRFPRDVRSLMRRGRSELRQMVEAIHGQRENQDITLILESYGSLLATQVNRNSVDSYVFISPVLWPESRMFVDYLRDTTTQAQRSFERSLVSYENSSSTVMLNRFNMIENGIIFGNSESIYSMSSLTSCDAILFSAQDYRMGINYLSRSPNFYGRSLISTLQGSSHDLLSNQITSSEVVSSILVVERNEC
jgi:hypothetical protein